MKGIQKRTKSYFSLMVIAMWDLLFNDEARDKVHRSKSRQNLYCSKTKCKRARLYCSKNRAKKNERDSVIVKWPGGNQMNTPSIFKGSNYLFLPNVLNLFIKPIALRTRLIAYLDGAHDYANALRKDLSDQLTWNHISYVIYNSSSSSSSSMRSNHRFSWLSLSRYPYQLAVALGKSSRRHPVFSQLINISFCWSANTDVSVCQTLLEKVTYEFLLTFLVLLSMSCSSYLERLWDRR